MLNCNLPSFCHVRYLDIRYFYQESCAGLGLGRALVSAASSPSPTGACSLCWTWRPTPSAAAPATTSRPGTSSRATGRWGLELNKKVKRRFGQVSIVSNSLMIIVSASQFHVYLPWGQCPPPRIFQEVVTSGVVSLFVVRISKTISQIKPHTYITGKNGWGF